MRARSVLRAATVTVVGFAAGLAAGEAVERVGVDRGADRARARTSTRAPMPYAGAVPSPDAAVLSSDALADIELTDRRGRAFTLDRLAGNVVVIGFAPTPCDADCARRIEELRRAYRRLGERSSEANRGAGAGVEFVLVSSAAATLPDVATAPDAEGREHEAGSETGGRRWRAARVDPEELAALRGRFGLASAVAGATGDDRPAVHVLDARGRLVQRYRADPLDAARLGNDVAWLRERGPGCSGPSFAAGQTTSRAPCPDV